MNVLTKASLCVALSFALAGVAQAGEVRFSGFGQVVGGAVLDRGEGYPELGYDDNVDFSQESLFALQIDTSVTDNVDLTAQILARGQNDFDAELAWAYARIGMGENSHFKVGRQRTPFYRYSDFLDVGYAYPWLRTPSAVYNVPFSNVDGVSFNDQRYLGSWYSNVQVLVGGFDGDARFSNQDFPTQLDNLMGASWTMTYNDWLTLRAAYYQSDITIDGTDLDVLTAQLAGAGFGDLAAQMDYRDDRATFAAVGFDIERNGWLISAEYTRSQIDDSIYADKDQYYVSVARRFGDWTPYVVYGERSTDYDSSVPDSVNPLLPFAPFVQGAFESDVLEEQYTSVGVRWDVYQNVAVKFDYSVSRSDLNPGRDAEVASAGLVFTF